MWSSSSARARRSGVALVLALVAAQAALPAAGADAAGPRVGVTVIGPRGVVVRTPRAVRAGPARLRVDRRICRMAAATPLTALAQLRLPLRVTAGGTCSPSEVFVTAIGRQANAGRNGWTYKVGHRAGTASAASPSGSFGTGRGLRGGERVTWFWCVLGRRGCQRTLTARRVGAATVRVVGYDDAGRGVRIGRALVTVRDARGQRVRKRTGAHGTVGFRGLRGSWQITATRRGLVPALPGGAR